MLHKLTVQYDRLQEKRVFILLAQHQFANSINVGGRFRCSWPAAIPDFPDIDPVCFKRLIKSFNILFFHHLAGNSFVSLTS